MLTESLSHLPKVGPPFQGLHYLDESRIDMTTGLSGRAFTVGGLSKEFTVDIVGSAALSYSVETEVSTLIGWACPFNEQKIRNGARLACATGYTRKRHVGTLLLRDL